jgi:DNA primase
LARGFSEDVLSRIQEATDLAELVGETVVLRRRGRKLWGLCPFHAEKTPSFSVDPDRQLFYCFGCHVGGTAFTYLMKRDGLTFPEAVRRLAERAGIPVVEESGPATRRTSILRLLADAAQWYRRRLLDPDGGRVAREYLEVRGVAEAVQEQFGLGWAPERWDELTRYLLRQGYEPADLVEAGVAVQGARGPYDRMRGRIVFPIADAEGRIVGFGGRLLGDGQPKYLNSPETPVYHKGRTLYGAHIARRAWSEHPPVLVEGYFDVLACHQAGISQAVATLGTGLTEDHAKYLVRHSNRVILAYDRDEAGQKAAERAFFVLANHGITAYHIDFASGKDLDELLQLEGPDALREALAAAEPYLAWRIRQEAPGARGGPEPRSRAWRRVRPLLLAVSDPVERDGYGQLLERQWGMDHRMIAQALDEAQGAVRHNSQKSRHNMGRRSPKIGRNDENDELLGVLLQFPEQLEGVLATFPELCRESRWASVVDRWPPVPGPGFARWVDGLPESVRSWVLEVAARAVPATPAAAVDLARKVRARRAVARWQELMARAAEGPLDAALADEIRRLWAAIREDKQGSRREG